MFNDLAKKLLDTFATYIPRRLRIVRLEALIAPHIAELKELKKADTKDQETLIDAVKATGPVRVDGFVLRLDKDEHVKKTVIGTDELMKAIAEELPRFAPKVEALFEKLKKDKREHNEANPEKTFELKVDPAKGSPNVMTAVYVKGEAMFAMPKAA